VRRLLKADAVLRSRCLLPVHCPCAPHLRDQSGYSGDDSRVRACGARDERGFSPLVLKNDFGACRRRARRRRQRKTLFGRRRSPVWTTGTATRSAENAIVSADRRPVIANTEPEKTGAPYLQERCILAARRQEISARRGGKDLGRDPRVRRGSRLAPPPPAPSARRRSPPAVRGDERECRCLSIPTATTREEREDARPAPRLREKIVGHLDAC